MVAMQFPVEPAQLAQRALECSRVGDHHAAGEHSKVAHTYVYANYTRPPVATGDRALHFAGEGDVPAVGGAADGGGQDAGRAVF
jgi:hypothetical protein